MTALEFLPASAGTGIIPAGAGKIDPPFPLQNFGDGLQHHGSPDRAGVRLRLPTRAGGDERLKQLPPVFVRSEEHTSELQSPCNLVCRLLLEKKKKKKLYVIYVCKYKA